MRKGRRELGVLGVLGSGGRRNGEGLRGESCMNSREGVRESVLCCYVMF